jgi:hypothetical protein
MIYLFENVETGDLEELDYQMGTAPKIGDVVDGMRRVPSFVLDAAGVDRITNKYPYVSHRLPSTIRGCKLVKTKNGRMKPLIQSRRHELEVMARNDLQRDGDGV